MLIALWPLIFPRNNAHSGGTLVEPDITHRAIRGKEVIKRTPAMIAAEAHLQRLQEVDDGSSDAGINSGDVALPSIPNSNQSVRNAPVRVSRYERELSGRIPEALGTSITARDAIPFELNEAMKAYAAKQAADEDDETFVLSLIALTT